MKGFYRLLVILLCLLAIAGFAQAEGRVFDDAKVLSREQVLVLEREAQSLYDNTGFDVNFHTTNNSFGKIASDYNMDFYHANRDASQYPDGAMLSILFDIREYYETTRGRGQALLAHQGGNQLADIIQASLSEGNYFAAFQDYLSYVKWTLLPPQQAEAIKKGETTGEAVYGLSERDVDYIRANFIPATPLQRTMELLPYLLIGGLLLGLVYALYLKSKLNIAKHQTHAGRYLVPNSLKLTDAQDLYLYQTVVRTRIESNSSNNSRGGGFSSGSRGGTSYSSRGGKF